MSCTLKFNGEILSSNVSQMVDTELVSLMNSAAMMFVVLVSPKYEQLTLNGTLVMTCHVTAPYKLPYYYYCYYDYDYDYYQVSK